jgi:hypothetical protein
MVPAGWSALHFLETVDQPLNEHVLKTWIGRGSFLVLRPRSPDLIPLEFFFWGYVKDIIHQEKTADV